MIIGSQRTERSPEEETRPHVPDHCRVYAIGDIHGRLDLLRRLHGKILEDAALHPCQRQVVVYVGDYVDRGPDSLGVIGLLANDPLEGFERHHLKGNHEDFMLRFLDDGTDGDLWLINGGLETLESYGVFPQTGFSDFFFGPDKLETLRIALKAAVPETHLDFLSHLEPFHIEGNYLFVHAGIRPGVALEEQSGRDLFWIRDEFLDYQGDFGHFVVHGHSIRSKPDIRANRIGIDTGACRSGILTALVLEADGRRFLQT